MNYLLSQYAPAAASGRLVQVDALCEQDQAPPYVAVLGDIYIIGPLVVHCTNGGMHAIQLERGMVSEDFGCSVSSKQAEAAFEQACGPLRPGAFLALHSLRSYNFWHWTMEALVQVVTAKAAGFQGTYILPDAARRQPFIFESLEMLGVGPEQVILYDGQGWHLETLFIPEPIQATHGLRRHPKLLRALRNALVQACDKPQIGVERIYLARNDPGLARRVVNESELLQLLLGYDFQRVVLERLRLRDQIGLMAGARCLVAPHGAGMAHALFMPAGSLVIELFASDYVNPCMLPAMDFLQHRYFMFANHWLHQDDVGHIRADTFCLDITLKRELARRNGQ